MAQIINITSEALQATIRRLLPSQQGFGEDLQASNVITPIIDLTPSAEGSALQSNLAEAINFTDASAFDVSNTTTVLVNTTGFYRVFGTSTIRPTSAAAGTNSFTMSDGLASKTVWKHSAPIDGFNTGFYILDYDFIVFLSAGDSISAVVDSTLGRMSGSTRQVADVTGNITNPSDFSSQ